MSEGTKLAAFLLALQTSDRARKTFRRDPTRLMIEFDLNRTTIDAIFSHDTNRLWRILRGPRFKPPVPPHVGMASGVKAVRRRPRRKSS